MRMEHSENFKAVLEEKTREAESIIAAYLPKEEGFAKELAKAMNYSMTAGGKRLRPLLLQESFRLFGGTGEAVKPFMAAMEMIHTHSLIHDDLALSVRHGVAGAVGNDVVVPLGVGGEAGSLLLSPHDQRVYIQSIAVEEFFPLVGKHAASRAESRLNQSHTNVTPFKCSLPSVPEGFVTLIIQDFTVFVNCFVKHCRSLRVLLASPGTCLPPCATATLKERQNCHNISRHITQYSHRVHKYMVEYEHRVCCPWRDL